MRKLLAFLLIGCLFLAACGSESVPATEPATEATVTTQATEPPHEHKDHAGEVTPDRTGSAARQEVTVKSFIDGDTVHFHVPTDVMPTGVLKARFLAVNTPESTGKIEEYGKAASAFTREKLSTAVSILIESETAAWEPDSTGDRYLAWVWYKPAANAPYRNLNIELLQNGLALPSSAARNRYGDTCMAAIAQARAEKLHIYSGAPDPDYYYGDAVELTLKELRTNIESYSGMKVAFSGIVSSNSGTQGVYVEDYDAETDRYHGMYIYYGHGLSGAGLDVLSVGNEVRIVGSVQYYEGGGTWQVSDLTYRLMQPNDPGNIRTLSTGHSAAYRVTDIETFTNGVETVEREGQKVQMPYAELVLGTSVKLEGLHVTDVYTTDSENSSSNGAMTLTCTAEGKTVTVRTSVLLDADGKRITAEAYLGKTITVCGIVDLFDGSYQVKVFAANNITINE